MPKSLKMTLLRMCVGDGEERKREIQEFKLKMKIEEELVLLKLS